MADAFKACAVDGCNGNSHHLAKGCRGWCTKHYQRWRKFGLPETGDEKNRWGSKPDEFVRELLLADTNECIEWPFTCSRGRAMIRVNGKAISACRFICELVFGKPVTRYYEAAHSCGRGHLGCVNPRHLRWATPRENQADRIKHETHCRGTKSPNSKLTENDVLNIRRRALGGESQISLAKDYGVGRTTIARVIDRETWAWL